MTITQSLNLKPHFELVNGRQVLYVEGWPFIALAAETYWADIIYGRYSETMGVYDYLYPAARALGLNTIKIPIKWSMIEPEQGVYDFTYLDHVKHMAEANDLKLIVGWFGHYASCDGNIYVDLSGQMFAPMYVIEDEKSYPRAVDADGVIHHNAISYDYEPIIEVETAAFRAFMEHIKAIDVQKQTIIMVQVENEISIFGPDHQNRKRWRDHSPASNKRFEEKGFNNDLKYSAWRLSSAWIKKLTDVGTEVYPIPFFLNNVGGTITDWMVGGAPGEDVATYLENCSNLSFIGLNLYAAHRNSVDDFRSRIDAYRVGRNIPAITETNSDRGPNTPRLAYLAVGEYGVPIFAPWSLPVSHPMIWEPYVIEDGTIANGGYALRDCYLSLRKALSLIAYYADTAKLAVFMSPHPGQDYAIRDLNGSEIRFSTLSATDIRYENQSSYSGPPDGQAIVIHPAENEFYIVGYRCAVVISTPMVQWPDVKRVRVEQGCWDHGCWESQGEYFHFVNQTDSTLQVLLHKPMAVYIHW